MLKRLFTNGILGVLFLLNAFTYNIYAEGTFDSLFVSNVLDQGITDDSISSIQTTNAKVNLYEKSKYRGGSVEVNTEGEVVNLTIASYNFDNITTSFKITSTEAVWEVKLYRLLNGKGVVYIFNQNTKNNVVQINITNVAKMGGGPRNSISSLMTTNAKVAVYERKNYRGGGQIFSTDSRIKNLKGSPNNFDKRISSFVIYPSEEDWEVNFYIGLNGTGRVYTFNQDSLNLFTQSFLVPSVKEQGILDNTIHSAIINNAKVIFYEGKNYEGESYESETSILTFSKVPREGGIMTMFNYGATSSFKIFPTSPDWNVTFFEWGRDIGRSIEYNERIVQNPGTFLVFNTSKYCGLRGATSSISRENARIVSYTERNHRGNIWVNHTGTSYKIFPIEPDWSVDLMLTDDYVCNINRYSKDSFLVNKSEAFYGVNNDSISSVIRHNAELDLYQHTNYEGYRVQIEKEDEIVNLSKMRVTYQNFPYPNLFYKHRPFNDKTSSFKISPFGPGWYSTLFQHKDGKGEAYRFEAAAADLKEMHVSNVAAMGMRDNRISSVKTHNARIILYNGVNYKGSRTTLNTAKTIANLTRSHHDFNDRLSSFKIIPTGPGWYVYFFQMKKGRGVYYRFDEGHPNFISRIGVRYVKHRGIPKKKISSVQAAGAFVNLYRKRDFKGTMQPLRNGRITNVDFDNRLYAFTIHPKVVDWTVTLFKDKNGKGKPYRIKGRNILN